MDMVGSVEASPGQFGYASLGAQLILLQRIAGPPILSLPPARPRDLDAEAVMGIPPTPDEVGDEAPRSARVVGPPSSAAPALTTSKSLMRVLLINAFSTTMAMDALATHATSGLLGMMMALALTILCLLVGFALVTAHFGAQLQERLQKMNMDLTLHKVLDFPSAWDRFE